VLLYLNDGWSDEGQGGQLELLPLWGAPAERIGCGMGKVVLFLSDGALHRSLPVRGGRPRWLVTLWLDGLATNDDADLSVDPAATDQELQTLPSRPASRAVALAVHADAVAASFLEAYCGTEEKEGKQSAAEASEGGKHEEESDTRHRARVLRFAAKVAGVGDYETEDSRHFLRRMRALAKISDDRPVGEDPGMPATGLTREQQPGAPKSSESSRQSESHRST
jgi:hypothetical protein